MSFKAKLMSLKLNWLNSKSKELMTFLISSNTSCFHSTLSKMRKETLKTLTKSLEKDTNKIPPAGSGECCPLNCFNTRTWTVTHHWHLAEFWWGVTETRDPANTKKYYAFAKANVCTWSLVIWWSWRIQPLLENPAEGKELDILFQDEHIVVVHKPAGFLSVPCKTIKDSAYTRAQEMHPDVEGRSWSTVWTWRPLAFWYSPSLTCKQKACRSSSLLVKSRSDMSQWLKAF